MNTFLSSEQKTLQDKFRAFAKEEIAPHVKALQSHSFDLNKLFAKLGQLGYLSGNLLDIVFLAEAISEYDPGLALTMAQHIAVLEVIKKYGNDSQKSRYLSALEQGKTIATFAFSEANAGVDYQAVETTIKADSTDYALKGEKTWVVNGEFASLFLVLAKDSNSGLMLVFVDKANTNKDSLKINANLEKLGLNSTYTNDITFNNVKVIEENKIKSSDKISKIALFTLDIGKIILSAGAVGMLNCALKLSVEHARERKQFGTNIGQFQAIQWKLADFATELTGASLQVLRAAWSYENDPSNFVVNAAMCKLSATKAARTYTGEAIQILGAKGLSLDTPLERFYGDAKAMEICLGTSEFQKILLTEALVTAE